MSESMVSSESTPTTRSKVAPRWLKQIAAYIVFFLVVILIWQGSKALFAIPDYKLPNISQIVEAFFRQTPQGPTWWILLYNAAYTALEAVTGFTIGAVVGFLFAVLFIQAPFARRGLMPFVIASQTIPIIAIAPMIVVGLGRLGAPPWVSKSAIAAYLTFFPVTINSLRGLEAISQDALLLMKSYAATNSQIFWKLRLPNSAPYVFTALKISATASVIGAIIGELPVGSKYGIGVQIVIGSQYNTFNPGYLWATIITAALLGILFYGAVALVERRVVKWRRD